MGLPAVVITPQGRALVVSAAVSQYASDLRIGARDEVQFANASAQAILIETIEGRRPTGCSIPVAGAGKVPFVAHVMPLRGAGLVVFSGAAFLLYITPVTQQVSPSGELLQALFDLSPAEARVAGLIAEGKSVDAIADSLAVTPNTVRTQLKAIFTKTGVGRQAELATLLSAAGLQKQPWKQQPR
jgi:DNA-binding CsgD family transcriptional regulator